MQRRIFSLLFLIAGVLLFQSVQAQIIVVNPPPLVNAGMGDHLTAPPGTYEVSGATTQAATLYAHDGGTITGVEGNGGLALNLVEGTGEVRMLRPLALVRS